MKLAPLVLLSGLGLALAACSTVRTPPAAPAAVTAAAPAPVAGYDWFFNADAQHASLAYGVAESDDVPLSLECDKAKGKLLINAAAPTGAREIHLESGGDTERFRAHAEDSPIHEGVDLTAEAATREPVFQRFRRVGWLAQWQGGQRETYVPHPESASGIERFFAFCG